VAPPLVGRRSTTSLRYRDCEDDLRRVVAPTTCCFRARTIRSPEGSKRFIETVGMNISKSTYEPAPTGRSQALACKCSRFGRAAERASGQPSRSLHRQPGYSDTVRHGLFGSSGRRPNRCSDPLRCGTAKFVSKKGGCRVGRYRAVGQLQLVYGPTDCLCFCAL